MGGATGQALHKFTGLCSLCHSPFQNTLEPPTPGRLAACPCLPPHQPQGAGVTRMGAGRQVLWIRPPARGLVFEKCQILYRFFNLVVCPLIQFSSVAQSCPTLCDPMNHSTPGLPIHPQLPEFTQTHVHRVGDAIQPSHPLSVPFSSCLQSFPTSGSFQMSQLFTSGGQNIGVSASTSVLPMNTQD